MAPAAAAKIPLAGVEAFPNSRTSNDPPTNAIDGSTATFTWSTESLNTAIPSYLAIGFAPTPVNRLRLFKTPEGGGGQNVKNLVIQYTTGSGALSSRSWSNVPNLRNGFGGTELLQASAVNADGTVSGDVHSGYASLSFDTVQATGLRVGFANPSSAGTCSTNPTGPCNHYRVAELEAWLDGARASPGARPRRPGRPTGGISLAARGALTKLVGQRVTLTARARRLPRGASIVIIGIRANGTTFVVSACPVGVRVCTRRAFTNVPRTVRFQAIVRRRGLTLRRSRVLTVTWRARPAARPTPAPTSPLPVSRTSARDPRGARGRSSRARRPAAIATRTWPPTSAQPRFRAGGRAHPPPRPTPPSTGARPSPEGARRYSPASPGTRDTEPWRSPTGTSARWSRAVGPAPSGCSWRSWSRS